MHKRSRMHPPSAPAGLVCAAAALLATPPPARAHTPFGYQSNSARSWEFRNGDPSSGGDDPSTYAGAVHYDPLHHALYVTGSTFATSVFDGVDVYDLTNTEQEEKQDENPNNIVSNTTLNLLNCRPVVCTC